MDIGVLRESLDRMKPIAGQIADRFFENLWADYPQSKPLFKDTEMGPQKFAFFNAITFVIDTLDKPADLEPFLRGLGGAHVAYGVRDEHYGWMGVTLFKTFSQFLGSAWTETLAQEWANAYRLISSLMLEGAKDYSHGVSDNPLEKVRHLQTLAETVASTPVSLPDELRTRIRLSVQKAVREAIRAEVDKVTQEELTRFTQEGLADYLKKAA